MTYTPSSQDEAIIWHETNDDGSVTIYANNLRRGYRYTYSVPITVPTKPRDAAPKRQRAWASPYGPKK